MSQADLAVVGKFVLAFCGYFIGTGLSGMIIAEGDLDAILTVAHGLWVVLHLQYWCCLCEREEDND